MESDGLKIYRTNLRRRKKNVVDRGFQYRIISLVLFTVLGTFVVYTILLLLYFRFFADIGIKELRHILSYVLFNDLLLMIAFSFIGVRYTNRIAGPVFRVQSDIDRVLGGEDDVRINFREKDHFRELSVSVNRLLEEYYRLKGTHDSAKED